MLINTHDVGIGEVISDNGAWMPEEIELLQPFMRGIVVDAGAAIGTHTLEFAKTADHVYAFEPNPVCYYTLCANLLLNNVFNVDPIQAALGDRNGTIPGTVCDPRGMNSTGGPAIGEGDWNFRIVTFDSLHVHPVAFAKIDVEGYEVKVLEGMRETIEQDSPVIWVEFHSEALLREGCAFLRGLGYKGETLLVTHDKRDPSTILCQSMLFVREGASD